MKFQYYDAADFSGFGKTGNVLELLSGAWKSSGGVFEITDSPEIYFTRKFNWIFLVYFATELKIYKYRYNSDFLWKKCNLGANQNVIFVSLISLTVSKLIVCLSRQQFQKLRRPFSIFNGMKDSGILGPPFAFST